MEVFIGAAGDVSRVPCALTDHKKGVKIMKIIIAGDGKVGESLARQLTSEGYDITLIDSDQDVLESSAQRYDVMTVVGNCSTMDTLRRAEVEDAELLIAVTDSDECNLLCCLTAHSINSKIHTIARIRNPEYAQQAYMMREALALSLSVNPERQAAMEIGRLLRYPGFLRRETFAKGRVEIVELRITSESKIAGAALHELNRIVKCSVLVCAVLRGGEALIPDGNFILRAGDRIYVTAPSETLSQLLKNLDIITHKVKRVMLAGGSRIAYYLSEYLLKSGIAVKLIERDYNRCLELAETLPQADIVHGDASNLDLLESEGILSCDAFVTLTGLDELNMILSIYGTQSGVAQVITKLGRYENTKIVDSLPIGSVISPKNLCCNTIVQYVRALRNKTGAAVAVHLIADGRVEAIEFLADASTPNCGVTLRDLKLRKNVLIVCITHEGVTEIPNGSSSYHPGDTLVVVSSGGEVIYSINDIFA